MKRIIPFIWLFLAVVVQASVLKYFDLYGASLNLILIILLLSVFEKSRYQRIIFGAFFAGWLLGALSGLPFGSLALVMIASVLLFDWFLFLLPRDSFVHFLLMVVCGTLIYNFILVLVLSTMKLAGLPGIYLELSRVLVIGVVAEIFFNLIGASALYQLRKWIIL